MSSLPFRLAGGGGSSEPDSSGSSGSGSPEDAAAAVSGFLDTAGDAAGAVADVGAPLFEDSEGNSSIDPAVDAVTQVATEAAAETAESAGHEEAASEIRDVTESSGTAQDASEGSSAGVLQNPLVVLLLAFSIGLVLVNLGD